MKEFENLTPHEAIPYSGIRSMEGKEDRPDKDQSEQPVSLEANDITPKKTPKIDEPLQQYWDKKIAETTDPAEREALKALRDSGAEPMRGGANDINLEGIQDLEIRNLGNQINEFLSATGSTLDTLIEAWRSVSQAMVRPEQTPQKNLLIQRVNERIRQETEKQEDIHAARERAVRRRERYYQDIGKIKELLESRVRRDEEFNDLFAGVDATPHEFFDRAFNPLTYGMRYEEFMDIIRKGSINGFVGDRIELTEDEQRELTKDLQRYQIERRVRQTLHDINAVVYLPSIKAEDLFKNMQQISTELEDFAFKMPGVRQMMDIYESALREDMRETGGYLRPESVRGHVITETQNDGSTVTRVERGEVEEAAKRRFKELMAKGLIIVRKPNRDNPGEVDNRVISGLKDWEIDRIFTIARGMLITTERLISIAAESRLPKGGLGRYTSLFLQDVLQSYSPYIHLLAKYGVTESGLAAYLYKKKDGKSLMDILRMWSPKELEKILEKFKDDPLSILESTDDMFYLMRENPNRAGDLFTWLSWRASENPDVVSMTQKFLQEGRKRMERRLAQGLNPQGMSEEDYKNEYANWIGTGLRLERLRGDLSNLRSKDSKQREKANSAKAKAEKIIGQMVNLQPHRLYLVSREIRERLDISDAQKQNISKILENLSLVENKLLYERETLLDNGETFETLTLDRFFDTIEDPQERADAEGFAQKVRQDYEKNRKLYNDEFIYKREYKHGFVLWSGDAPVDEFNVAALGPTGGSARRARDNTMQAEAIQEELKLLSNLRKIQEPEEVVEALTAIYDKLSIYDTGKAKQAIFEKAEGIAKFFAADWFTKIPYAGQIMRLAGHGSFAQTVYGRSAPVWEASKTRHLFLLLKNRQLITDEHYKNLQENVFSGNIDVAIDVGGTIAELLAIAMMLYLIEQSLKEK